MKYQIIACCLVLAVSFTSCRRERSLNVYQTQVQRIESARQKGKITEAEYIRLINDAENSYSGREDTKRPNSNVFINNN